MVSLTRRRALAALLVAAVPLPATVAALVPAQRRLVVEDQETGERYLSEPVADGSTVGLEYTHSVEKSRVYDVYRVDGDRLLQVRMEFESYGWGLPTSANVTIVDGTFVYEPDEPIVELRRLAVSPGRVAGHTLVVDGRRHDLVAATDGRDVTLSVERSSLLERYL
ncbi:DUF1850 domain-containing protein [Halovivax limisalsi]|uniref:DUF1850 domain-containing protein n=1 Tax=Halovivax limisalsi TaxID=1453760 RepID=UPI001FFD011A|nr:DUF1850 domain-containing protein [Halovivax limisalsi]